VVRHRWPGFAGLLLLLVIVGNACGGSVPEPSTRTGVAVVGDSLTVPISGALRQQLARAGWKDVRVDAAVGREIATSSLAPSGVAAVSDLKKRGFDPPAWIVALGTNDIAKTGDPNLMRTRIEQLVDAIGDRRVLWVNIWRSDSPALSERARQFNDVLASVAAERPNLDVDDWASEADGRPELFGPDKVHLNLRGDDERVKQLVDAAEDVWS
jgi:lysophospholipase L1-like esterase